MQQENTMEGAGSKKRKVEDVIDGEDAGVEDAEAEQQQQHEHQPHLDGLDRDDVMKILEPLDRETMLEIIREACIQHPAVLLEVRKFVDRDPAHRKLFVRGLGWETSSETLRGIFSHFGELEEGTVIRDKTTQKSRGFGFVTFRHMDGAVRALKEPSKRIDGRITVCQFASWAPSVKQPVEDVSLRKIYVGNVPVGFPADKVLGSFSQFGEIAEGPLGFDKTTGVSKGFALIIYKTSEGARNALSEPYKTIDGHQVHCKLAMDGHKHNQQQNIPQQQVSKPEMTPMQLNRRSLPPGIPINMNQSPGISTNMNMNQSTGISTNMNMNQSPGISTNMNMNQSPGIPINHIQNQPVNSFQPTNYPAVVSVPPVYNYNPSAVYGPPQSAGYGSSPFYVNPHPVPTGAFGLGGLSYPQQVTIPLGPPVPAQQLTIPSGPVQTIGAIPNLPANFGN